jgi:predicted metalloprotease with PDZ domain
MKRRILSCGLIGVAAAVAMAVPAARAQEPIQELGPAQAVGAGQTLLTLDFNAISSNSPLGFEVEAIAPPLRAQLGLPEGEGIVVASILPDSDAAKAGLEQYDVLQAIDDAPITGPEMFHESIGKEPGKKVSLRVLRQAKPLTVEIAAPAVAAPTWLQSYAVLLPPENRYRIGVTLTEADEVLRSQLRLAAGEGLVVTDVVADSPAAKAGVQRHDVLIKLDAKRLSTVDGLNAQVQEISDRAVNLELLRRGVEVSCELTPQLSNNDSVTTLRDAASLSLWLQPSLWQIDQRANTNLFINSLPATQSESGGAPAAGDTAAQLAQLKRQLADVQKLLEALEASLQTAPPAPMPNE